MATAIFAFLWSMRKRWKAPGFLFGVYLMFNGVERFFIEKIRVNAEMDWLGMTFTQAELISTLTFLGGLALTIWVSRKPKVTMESLLPSHSMQALTQAAVEVICPVGEYLVEQRVAEADIEVKGLNSLVSHVDKTAEARLVKGLQALLPEAGFLAEEGTAGASDDARFRWVVDPLDGTTNLIHGLPCCVSVALVDGHQPVVAIMRLTVASASPLDGGTT